MPEAGAVRESVIRFVAASVVALGCDGVLKVGVDGVDGAGKTVFADELGREISRLGRPVIRAGIDGFHRPRSVRYRRGRHSPEGYFHDSYDYTVLREVLLDPLSAGGDGNHRRAVFDHVTDCSVDSGVEHADPGSVLVFDGIFLHRAELVEYWDYSVFLDVSFDVAVARMSCRDGTDPDPDEPVNQRYVRGQMRYLATCAPAAAASVVIDNTDLGYPCVRPSLRTGQDTPRT